MRKSLLISLAMLCGCSSFSGKTNIREFNDFFSAGGSSDKNFTQGLEVSHTFTAQDSAVSKAASYLPSFSKDHLPVDTSTISIGQKIYTPKDLSKENPDPNDTPYAGWLYGELTRHSKVDDVIVDTSLSLGMVGPSAQGQEIQSWFHQVVDSKNPNGWHYQLYDEPTVMLTHDRKWLDDRDNLFGNIEWGSTSEVEGRLGNAHTDLTLTKAFMLGGFDATPQRFSYYFFTKFGTSVIARNIFYDGNTFRDSRSVNKEVIVGFVTPGLHFTYKGIGLEFAVVSRTKDFEEQSGNLNTYGTITLGFVPEDFMESIQ